MSNVAPVLEHRLVEVRYGFDVGLESGVRSGRVQNRWVPSG